MYDLTSIFYQRLQIQLSRLSTKGFLTISALDVTNRHLQQAGKTDEIKVKGTIYTNSGYLYTVKED